MKSRRRSGRAATQARQEETEKGIHIFLRGSVPAPPVTGSVAVPTAARGRDGRDGASVGGGGEGQRCWRGELRLCTDLTKFPRLYSGHFKAFGGVEEEIGIFAKFLFLIALAIVGENLCSLLPPSRLLPITVLPIWAGTGGVIASCIVVFSGDKSELRSHGRHNRSSIKTKACSLLSEWSRESCF